MKENKQTNKLQIILPVVDAVTGFVTDSENQIETNCYVTLKISPKIKLKKKTGAPSRNS